MPGKAEGLSTSLRFDPHWIADPAWWFYEDLGQEIRQQAAEVQLELTRAVLAANLQAVEKMQAIVSRAGQG